MQLTDIVSLFHKGELTAEIGKEFIWTQSGELLADVMEWLEGISTGSLYRLQMAELAGEVSAAARRDGDDFLHLQAQTYRLACLIHSLSASTVGEQLDLLQRELVSATGLPSYQREFLQNRLSRLEKINHRHRNSATTN